MSSLYSISIPVLINCLTATSAVLKKGAEHAREKGVADSEYLGARVHEDMQPLHFQIRIVCAAALKAVERLTGAAPAGLEFDAAKERATFGEWLAAVDETVGVLRGVSPAAVDGRERVRVPCVLGPETYEADLADYVPGYPVPTAYFHLTIAYAILRAKGVPIGKADYIAPFVQNFTKA